MNWGLLGRINRGSSSAWSLHSNSAPKHSAQPHDHPGSKQNQDVQDKESLVFWIGPSQKTSIVYPDPGSQFVVSGLLSQTMLKLERFMWMSLILQQLEAMLMSLAQVTTEGHINILDLGHSVRPS